MKFAHCGDRDEIFTHEDDDGTVRHFNATRMLQFARSKSVVERCNIELVEAQVEFIKRSRGIERPKVDRLIEPYLSQPILFIEFEPGIHLTVDGHHRIVRNWEDGKRVIHAYRFPFGVWQPFLVEDLENITLAKLAEASQRLKEAGIDINSV